MSTMIKHKFIGLEIFPMELIEIICIMDDVRGDFLGPPHDTTPAAVTTNKNKTEIL